MQRPLWGLAVALTPDTVYAPGPPAGTVAPAPTTVRVLPVLSPAQASAGTVGHRPPAAESRAVVATPKGSDRPTVPVIAIGLLIVCGGVYWSKTHQVQAVSAPTIEPTPVQQPALQPPKRLEPEPAEPPAKKVADKPAPRRVRAAAASAASPAPSPEPPAEPLSSTLTRFREGL